LKNKIHSNAEILTLFLNRPSSVYRILLTCHFDVIFQIQSGPERPFFPVSMSRMKSVAMEDMMEQRMENPVASSIVQYPDASLD